MPGGADDYTQPLDLAAAHVRDWLDGLSKRQVRPTMTVDEAVRRFGGPLPETGLASDEVVDYLAEQAEPGLMAVQSSRFFGWVMGGSLPAALAADWLVGGWGQNGGMRLVTPSTAAIEQAAGAWILDLLGLPAGCDVGFTTGATMANFTGLAAARWRQLSAVGWDVNASGLLGAPPLRVLAGEERHSSLDLALRYLGLGRPELVPCDGEGRIDAEALRAALEADTTPAIVCLQAGNLHSGAFDPFRAAITAAKQHGAWVHVDGAFGLWAGAVPRLAPLVDGLALADSWATDAHKTLNAGYDCGVSIVRDAVALRSAMGAQAAYFIQEAGGDEADPMDKVPEMSRRARGVPAWAALRALGRKGVEDLIAGRVRCAVELGRRLAALPGVEVLNDVVYTQLAVAFGTDERTKAVADYVMADGRVWMSGSRWRDRAVLRVSVTNWQTDFADLDVAVEVIREALEATA